jgi:hypothetical protein
MNSLQIHELVHINEVFILSGIDQKWTFIVV